jgi:S1-C subfamily serine protease
MKRKQLFSFLLTALLLAPTFAPIAQADEGMWTFNNVPRAEIKRRYKFDVTDAWLRKIQLASVRFNSGGSGSFISQSGLVLTNHHVASETLAKLSTKERDIVKAGYPRAHHRRGT